MTTANQAFRQAANSPAAHKARDAGKSAADTARNIGEDVSDYASDAARKASDFASDVSRRAGREFDRARGAAADAWDELHDASERNPHVTLLVAFGLGLLFGIFAGSRR
jgi:ElaB/YqjD/DUF883 family membrane-anchored ribosome-binding protein